MVHLTIPENLILLCKIGEESKLSSSTFIIYRISIKAIRMG